MTETNSDLERLLELYLNYINHVPHGEVPNEFHQIKSKLESQLKDATKWAKFIKGYDMKDEYQINKLKQKLKIIKEWTESLDDMISFTGAIIKLNLNRFFGDLK